MKINKTKEKIFKIGKNKFAENGYEKTSIESIIEEANIAKGTFYYYFKSKEQFLDDLMDYMFLNVLEGFDKIINNKNLSSKEKLFSILKRMINMKLNDSDFTKKMADAILKNQMEIIFYKFTEKYVKKLFPYLKIIVEEGVENGEFELEYIDITLEHLLHMISYSGDIKKLISDKNYRKEFVLARERILEKILGLKKGKVTVLEELLELG
ncbi:TetR/AcrR family transcriptional regulator [Haliovirga abyssi]|uniref:TetR family transcriptional regulator n=1 Tax=Haliovirga abyssi TaxID=2996794 RepID=A0AAU9DM77_9FUSO|nr:TetR/AcrR family transcriptional regulator [Haliovirga abyssi]BDU51102.1 TetR family transcriptional regulator [Haliovirga abyssi]